MFRFRMDTTELPVEHRYDAWTEIATKLHVPAIVDSRHRPNFVATMEAYDLGVMQLSRVSQPPLRARGTRAIAAAAANVILLSHVTSGSLTVRTDGRAVTAEAGSLVVIDPGRLTTAMNPVEVSHQILRIPTEVLGLSRAQIDALSANPLGARECIGGMLGYIVDDLLRHSGEHKPAVVAQLTSSVVDLLGTAARMALATGATTGTRMPKSSRLLQIYAFMQQRLADVRLTPDLVAATHSISLRQLNRMLQEVGESPADWIRTKRLERCRRDLIDPALAGRPVAVIGSRWGFTDPATFNRAFRREFGLPPGEFRRRFALPRADRVADTLPQWPDE